MGMSLFGKNFLRLFKFDLKAHHKTLRELKNVPLWLDNLKYEIADEIQNIKLPKVMTPQESIEEILNSNKSVVRFGDGEFNLILGNSIGFQEYSPELAQRLTDVLMTKDNNILIGIYRFGSLSDINAQSRAYWRGFMSRHRQKLYTLLDFDKTYINAGLTILGIEAEDHRTPEWQAKIDTYYNSVRQIWDGKDITIIKGAGTEKFTHDIYDNARSITYIYGPKENAFRDYDKILAEALKLPKDRLIIAALGPTAKLLAYDLHKQGYRVLDLGHMGKAYDWLKTHEGKIVAGQFFAA